MELIELKFIFDRNHHDNRDYVVFPDYQHRESQSLHEQCSLFGKHEGKSWLLTFLKVYIRAFQQASDLDDTVEEKLLIGDRPKQAVNANKKNSLKERLVEEDPDCLSELTSDEARFVEYANSLANWLECYHDYTRPPAAVVLAEAAKQTELKTGHPLKGIEIPPASSNNGQYRKEEDPPAIQEPPEIVTKFFSNMKSRFDEVATTCPAEMLHVATLTQEAFLILVVETLRFKSPSIVKINKFGPLVTKFKELRSDALSTLKDVATQLVKRGEYYGTVESRKALAVGRSPMLEQQIDQDFRTTQVKKINDARKKVLEGVGKGMLRIAMAYAS
jgi:N-terminal acetyltransferase B complex non-catalytic subunit